ncbi:MAG: transposase, partial [Deltaproteobacteria bacterium]|nr:transposase [Deltaproteobacteria bacterium]
MIAKAIDWDLLERQLSHFFNDKIGRPALPIRLMAGLLFLQRIYNLSDEQTVKNWRENIYFQAFTGGTRFSMSSPCHPSMMTLIRKRIGKEGCSIIFKETVRINGGTDKDKIVI